MNLRSPDHVVVTFEGADALSFLQSQLTNDVAALAVGDWQWQGYCTAKGRLQATFALARSGEHSFLAVLHHSVSANLVKRLTMFRMRAKLAIAQSATAAVQLHLSPPATDGNRLATLDLGHGRWFTVDNLAESAALSQEQGQQGQQNSDVDAASTSTFMQRWNLLGIEALQPEITAATAEMFVPQMLNWDHVQPGGGVSFSKGCYPGQEVVARAHYRGAVKRMLEQQTLPIEASHVPGSETVLSDGRSAEICNSVPRGASSCHLALVVVAPLSEVTV
jgi:tRNA-modifying protein YgfZ